MNDSPQSQQEAVDRASRIIAQALMEAEVVLAAERESRLPQLPPQLIETIDRFGDVLARLVETTERLSDRVHELGASVEAMAGQREERAHAAAAAASTETAYTPGGEGIDVTIAAVPGFQGLMEVQRTLVRMPQVQSASVRRYQDDQASIQLVLSQPLTASAISEGVSTGTGRQLVGPGHERHRRPLVAGRRRDHHPRALLGAAGPERDDHRDE